MVETLCAPAVSMAKTLGSQVKNTPNLFVPPTAVGIISIGSLIRPGQVSLGTGH